MPGEVGEAQPVAPLDELYPHGGEPAHGGHRPVPAPDHHPVAELSHAQQGVHVLGGGVEGVDEVGQGGLLPDELPENFHGQAVVRLGQLQNVDVAGEQPLHHAVGGQTVHIAGGDVEQHPQRGGADGDGRQSLRRPGDEGGGVRPQFHFELVLQGLPGEVGPDLGQVPVRQLHLGEQAVKLPPVQPPAQPVNGGNDQLRERDCSARVRLSCSSRLSSSSSWQLVSYTLPLARITGHPLLFPAAPRPPPRRS